MIEHERTDVPYGAPLSRRERECIAECIIHGDQREAAYCVGISYQTLKNYVSRALTKTGTGSYGQAAHQLGWFVVPANVTRHSA